MFWGWFADRGRGESERVDLLEAFGLWHSAQARWTSTAKRHRLALLRLATRGLVRVEDATRERVTEVQAGLLAAGWQVDSVRSELNAVRAVLSHLDDLGGVLAPGQLAGVRKAALKREIERRRRVRFLTRAEHEHLASGAARLMPRLEAPIRVAALAGPRVGELARMRAEDVHGQSFSIETLPEWGEAGTCKTGPRVVPICAELRAVLDRCPKSGWLFPAGSCSRPGQVNRPFMSRGVLERALRVLRRRLHMADDITWTVLRHTRASWWLQGARGQKGASIYKVSDWLGHSVLTCEWYYGSLLDGYDPECESAPAA